MDINSTEEVKVEIIPDELWLSANPSICTYPMIADLKDRKPDTMTPILKYSDPQANYTLYTDASKYMYASVLTQHSDGTDHPITYVSGLFRGSQLNWANLTKEAYTIYNLYLRKLSH